MAMAVELPQRPCSGLGVSTVRARRQARRGAACRAPQADRRSLSKARRSRSRWSVCTVDLEERGPTAGVAESGLSGTAARLAAPLRGMHSRRDDSRLDR